jgi:hypothetical protein
MQVAAQVRSALSVIVLSLGALCAVAAPKETGHGGMICIAAFKPAKDNLPNMSPETWGPSPKSVFTFQIGKRVPTAVHINETVVLRDVSVDHRILVRVKLDERPFESFWLNLRREPNHRVCLWLYPGYWHWIITGWNTSLGCTCK